MDAVSLRVFMGAAGSEPVFGYSVLTGFGSGVAVNGDDIVVVGSGGSVNPGRIAVSQDAGVSWYSFDNLAPTVGALRDIKYADSKWVAVGIDTIVVSTDLQTWQVTSFVSKSFTAVTYGLGQFVAVGNGGIIYTSPDAVTWTQQTSGTTTAFTSVAASATKIIAGTSSGGSVYVSTDGAAWSPVATGSTALQYVSFGDGVFVTGPRYSTDDGATWTATSGLALNPLRGIIWDGTYFLAVGSPGSSYVFRSADGISWSNASAAFVGTGVQNANAIGADTTTGTAIFIGSPPSIFSTADSFSTAVQNIGPAPYVGEQSSAGGIGALYWDGTKYIAASGLGYLATSTNGRDWTVGSPQFVVSLNYLQYPTAIARLTGSTYCIIGQDSGAVGAAATSADGLTWTSRTLGATTPMYDLESSGSLFVAVGGSTTGVVRTSPDGITWTARTSNATAVLNAVVYAASTFVAVGVNGVVVTSTNGTTWTARTSGTAATFNDVAYGAGLFVAVGNDGLIYTSPTGTTWTNRTISTTDDFACVSRNDAVFVASGQTGTYTSVDGIAWKKVFAYGGKKIVSSGLYQTVIGDQLASIIMSPKPPSPPYPS